MTIKITYAQFLKSSGVPMQEAMAVSEAVSGKVMARQPLSDAEKVLTAAFLSRPRANTIAERGFARDADLPWTDFSHSVKSPRDAASGVPTGKRQHKTFSALPSNAAVGVHGWDYVKKEKVEGGVSAGHFEAWPAKWKGFSLDGKANGALPPQAIRELSTAVALG